MLLFKIGDEVYLNGDITTNKFPRGDIGVNDIKYIYAINIKGSIYSIELPSLINQGHVIYTIKIFENLYAINVEYKQISYLPISSNGVYGFTSTNDLIDLYPLSINTNELNPLDTIEQYNRLSKQNYINSQLTNQYLLNQNRDIQKTISKYFYYKIIDDWLYKKLFPLLEFVELYNGKPHLIKNIKKYSMNKLSDSTDEEIEERAEYLEKKIITKKLVRQVLKKTVKRLGLNWSELNNHEKMIQKIFFEYLKDLLETSIESI